MSYDFRLFAPRADEDPLTTARRDATGEEPGDAARDPDLEVRKLRVASAIIAANPSLKPFQFRYEEIATREGISVEAAKRQYRHIELNGPDQGNGIQIQLYDNEVSVTVPCWHEGAQARLAFQEIWKYLQIIQDETGYVVYDPQLDTILELSQGHAQALNAYDDIYRTVVRDLPSTSKHSKIKYWWEFWRR